MSESILNFLTADVIGLVVNLFFMLTIVLMVLDKQKPPLATSILTGFALIVLGFSGSYHAHAVSAAAMLSGMLWLVLAWQRFRQS